MTSLLFPTLNVSTFQDVNAATAGIVTIGGAGLYAAVTLMLSFLLAWLVFSTMMVSQNRKDEGFDGTTVQGLGTALVAPLLLFVTTIVQRVLGSLMAIQEHFVKYHWLYIVVVVTIPFALIVDSFHDVMFVGLHKVWTCFLTAFRPLLTFVNLLGLALDGILPVWNYLARIIRRTPSIFIFTILGCGVRTVLDLLDALGDVLLSFINDTLAFLQSGQLLTRPFYLFNTGLSIEGVVRATETIIVCVCALLTPLVAPFYGVVAINGTHNLACVVNETGVAISAPIQEIVRVIGGVPIVVANALIDSNETDDSFELLRPNFNRSFDSIGRVIECAGCFIDEVQQNYYTAVINLIWDVVPSNILPFTRPVGPNTPGPFPKIWVCFFRMTRLILLAIKLILNFICQFIPHFYATGDGQLLVRPDEFFDLWKDTYRCGCRFADWGGDLLHFFAVDLLRLQVLEFPSTTPAPFECAHPPDVGCYVDHANESGCADLLCCTRVCAHPSYMFCCLTGWNHTCVQRAVDIKCNNPQNGYQTGALVLEFIEAASRVACCLIRTVVDLLFRWWKNLLELVVGFFYGAFAASPSTLGCLINGTGCPANTSGCPVNVTNGTIFYRDTYDCQLPHGPEDAHGLLRFFKFYWGDRQNASALANMTTVNEFIVTGEYVQRVIKCVVDAIDRILSPLQSITCFFRLLAQLIIDLLLLVIDFLIHLDLIIDDITYLLQLRLQPIVTTTDALFFCLIGGFRQLSPIPCVGPYQNQTQPIMIPCLLTPKNTTGRFIPCVNRTNDKSTTEFACCFADWIQQSYCSWYSIGKVLFEFGRNVAAELKNQTLPRPYVDIYSDFNDSLDTWIDSTWDFICALTFFVFIPPETPCPAAAVPFPVNFVKRVIMNVFGSIAGIVVALFRTLIGFVIAITRFTFAVPPMNLAAQFRPIIEALVYPFASAWAHFWCALADLFECFGVNVLRDFFLAIADFIRDATMSLVEILVTIIDFGVRLIFAIIDCVSGAGCQGLINIFAEIGDVILSIVNQILASITCFIQNMMCLAGFDGSELGVTAAQCLNITGVMGFGLPLCACPSNPLPCNFLNFFCQLFTIKLVEGFSCPCAPDHCAGAQTLGQFLLNLLTTTLSWLRNAVCDLNQIVCISALTGSPFNCPACTGVSILCLRDIVVCAVDPNYVRTINDGTCCFLLPPSLCTTGQPGHFPACFTFTGSCCNKLGCVPCLRKREYAELDNFSSSQEQYDLERISTLVKKREQIVEDVLYDIRASSVTISHPDEVMECYHLLSSYSTISILDMFQDNTLDMKTRMCAVRLGLVTSMRGSDELSDVPNGLFLSSNIFIDYLLNTMRGAFILKDGLSIVNQTNSSLVIESLRLMGIKNGQSAIGLAELINRVENLFQRDGPFFKALDRAITTGSEMIFLPRQPVQWTEIWRQLGLIPSAGVKRDSLVVYDGGYQRPSLEWHLSVVAASSVKLFDATRKLFREANWKDFRQAAGHAMSYVFGAKKYFSQAKRQVDSSVEPSSPPLPATKMPSFRKIGRYLLRVVAQKMADISAYSQQRIDSSYGHQSLHSFTERSAVVISTFSGVRLTTFNDSLIDMFMCDPNRQPCANCSVVDQLINETFRHWIAATDAYSTVYVGELVPKFNNATFELANNLYTINDTFATNPKEIPFILERLPNVQWPWRWNFTHFFSTFLEDPPESVTMPSNSSSSSSGIVTFQMMKERELGRPNIHLFWIDLLRSFVPGLFDVATTTGNAITAAGKSLVNFMRLYVLCDTPSYDTALLCKNNLGFGLFDGIVLALFLTVVLMIFIYVVCPCGITVVFLVFTFSFLGLTMVFGYQVAFLCSLPVEIQVTAVTFALPTLPSCIGSDIYELTNELLSPCAPIPYGLINTSDPRADEPCYHCSSSPPVIDCAHAAGFIDGFDNIFYAIGSLSPSLLKFLINSSILSFWPPLVNTAVRYTPEMLALNPAANVCFWLTIVSVFDAVLFLAAVIIYILGIIFSMFVPLMLLLFVFYGIAGVTVELATQIQLGFVSKYGIKT